MTEGNMEKSGDAEEDVEDGHEVRAETLQLDNLHAQQTRNNF